MTAKAFLNYYSSTVSFEILRLQLLVVTLAILYPLAVASVFPAGTKVRSGKDPYQSTGKQRVKAYSTEFQYVSYRLVPVYLATEESRMYPWDHSSRVESPLDSLPDSIRWKLFVGTVDMPAPPMYTALTGPREDKELCGLLKEKGYKTEQVYKF
jgi:hypothetical protein